MIRPVKNWLPLRARAIYEHSTEKPAEKFNKQAICAVGRQLRPRHCPDLKTKPTGALRAEFEPIFCGNKLPVSSEFFPSERMPRCFKC
ncbi:MAG: hypothetical protein D6714_13185 [Bacteroidetes bacterium]|nr:MAG: hypothetical protein D6714_13185 [Bacteroidota bacterium]